MNYMDRYRFWCEANLPADVQQELAAISRDEEELKLRFCGDLQFGTAGMRGIMGAGSNRLNVYTVRRAAQGMAAWLYPRKPPSVTIPDTIHKSSQKSALWHLLKPALKSGSMTVWPPRPCCPMPSGSWAAAAASSFLPATTPVLTTVSSVTGQTAAR